MSHLWENRAIGWLAWDCKVKEINEAYTYSTPVCYA